MNRLPSALPDSPLPEFPATTSVRRAEEPAVSFGSFRLEADGTLWRGGTLVHLPPKELAALRLLVENSGQIVSPLLLKQVLWGDVHVTADSVPKCLSSLRARLEPEACIQTVYKRGYRFSAEVLRQGMAAGGVLPRLVILPFATGYTVPEHLGAAIAEETMARLSNERHPVLSVLARDSVFALVRKGFTALQVGLALKSDLVLTGTLCVHASHFRLRAEMIRVEDGTQIWVEDLLASQSSITGLEDILAERLAFRLGTNGVPGDRSSSTGWNTGVPGDRSSSQGRKATVPGARSSSKAWKFGVRSEESPSPQRKGAGLSISAEAADESPSEGLSRQKEAFEIFLRGHHEWQTLQRHRMQDGLQYLLRANELDPRLIPAKVDLVHLCVTQSFYGFMSPTVAAGMVREAADSVPDLAQQAAEILPALGWINFHVDHDLGEALRAFSLSAHLPHDQWITRMRVMLALSRHRFDEASGLLRAAIQADPFSGWLHNRLAWTLHLSGQAAESLQQVRRNIAQFPDHDGTSLYGAMILAFNGEAARAVELAQGLAHRSPYFDLATAAQAYSLACAGRTDEARGILDRLQWLSRERFVLRAFTPAICLALGDPECALAELRAAEEARCPWFFQMLADPRLKPLEERPEFKQMRDLLTRMEEKAAHCLQWDQ
jgi:DNA-binding winged helix-turn-helix (wHTH) protein/tetratricopeptide (TPR) repeat protein